MELAFETRSLRTICEDPAEAAKRLDLDVVEALIRRLGDLRAASSPLEIFTGQPRFIEDPAQMLLRLSGHYELVLQPNHAHPRLNDHGNLDWGRVRRVQVLSIREAARGD